MNSKTTCVAYQLGRKYMIGTPIRQDYLETVLKWMSGNDVENYMATHQNDKNADREWQYFQQATTNKPMIIRRKVNGHHLRAII